MHYFRKFLNKKYWINRLYKSQFRIGKSCLYAGLFFWMIGLLISWGLIAMFEPETNQKLTESFWNIEYYWTVTMTTIGYGDFTLKSRVSSWLRSK